MMHFKDTEISFSPMQAPEIQYWLSQGHTIFTHRGTMWMRVRHYKGHRVLIEVPDYALAQVNLNLYANVNGIIRLNENVHSSPRRVP